MIIITWGACLYVYFYTERQKRERSPLTQPSYSVEQESEVVYNGKRLNKYLRSYGVSRYNVSHEWSLICWQISTQ